MNEEEKDPRLDIPCPRCGAPKGKECISVIGAVLWPGEYTDRPLRFHRERPLPTPPPLQTQTADPSTWHVPHCPCGYVHVRSCKKLCGADQDHAQVPGQSNPCKWDWHLKKGDG